MSRYYLLYVLALFAATPEALGGSIRGRNLNEFIPYTLPPFALTFETIPQQQGGAFTNEALRGPLKLLLSEFLFESFRIQISRTSDPIPDILRFPVTLYLDVDVAHKEHVEAGLTIYEVLVQFEQILYFLSPSTDQTNIPDADYVYNLFGAFVQTSFESDFEILKMRFLDSGEELLQAHSQLVVYTDVKDNAINDALVKSFETQSGASTSSRKRSKQENILLSFLILIGALTAVVALFIARSSGKHYRERRNNTLARGSSIRSQQLDGSFPRPLEPQEPLPGRSNGEDDVYMYALNGGDKFRANDAIMSPVSEPEEEATSPWYLRMMFSKNKTSGPTINNNSQRSLASQDNSHRIMDMDKNHDVAAEESEEAVEIVSPSSWWSKFTNSLKSPNNAALECDKNPSDYNFPFSDFPRSDGTPCLIYQESPGGEVSISRSYSDSQSRKSRHSNSQFASPVSNSSYAADPSGTNDNNLLTDDEFKRELSIQSQTTSQGEDSSIEETVEVEFTQKLGRLVAMKHRHYEHDRLVQNQQRRREAQDRDLQLRRHTMELDIDEIEARMTPKTMARKRMVTNETEPETKHRTVVSSDNLGFFAEEAIPPPPAHSIRKKASGPSNRVESSLDMMPPMKRTVPARRMYNKKHMRSHRRSQSHGMHVFEEKKTEAGLLESRELSSSPKHDDGQQQNGSAQDVVTFGIAAYTNLV